MIKIALTNLGKYNEGVLDFTWLDLPASEEEIAEAFNAIHVSYGDKHHYSTYGKEYGEYEEYFITDYETDIDIKIGEYSNLNYLNEIAEKLDDLNNWELETVKARIEAFGEDVEEAIDCVDDTIFYEGDSDDILDDIVDEYVTSFVGKDVPDIFLQYFDYESFKRDFLDNYIEVSNGLISRD